MDCFSQRLNKKKNTNDDLIGPYVDKLFDTTFLPAITDYIKIPNCSPNYDQQWNINGKQEKAAVFISNWVLNQNLKNKSLNIYKEADRTPFIFIEVSASRKDDSRTIVMYGHLDKQPEFSGWSEGLGPYTPVVKDGKLYGRGGADDGYAVFGVITSIKTCQDNNLPLPRIVMIIEGAEESYESDLEFYLASLKNKIGIPNLIVCLDSGCADYQRLWLTTSLRGVCTIDLTVKVLTEGVHSGGYGGYAPDSCLIIRKLLDRIEDSSTGAILIKELNVELPQNRRNEIVNLVSIIADDIVKSIPFYANTTPIHKEYFDLVVNNTWQPTLAITGAEGFPEASSSGNVLRPSSSIRCSIRLPPGVNSKEAVETVMKLLKNDPPYNSVIETKVVSYGDGWNLSDKNLSAKLVTILDNASLRYFGNNVEAFGEGGSIPFVQTFNSSFPSSDLAVLGVTGPGCNIHGPDENLNLDCCKKLIKCLAHLISEY